MLAPLTPEQKESLTEMMDKVLAWVTSGYRDEIVERFPEAAAPKPRRSQAAAR
jgi:hypothetical protein